MSTSTSISDGPPRKARARVLHVNWRKDVELRSRWWSLCACILLLGLEWLLRRRFGYL